MGTSKVESKGQGILPDGSASTSAFASAKRIMSLATGICSLVGSDQARRDSGSYGRYLGQAAGAPRKERFMTWLLVLGLFVFGGTCGVCTMALIAKGGAR